MTHSLTLGGVAATGVAGASTIGVGAGRDLDGDSITGAGAGTAGVGTAGAGAGIDHSGAEASASIQAGLTKIQIIASEEEEPTIALLEEEVHPLQEEITTCLIDKVLLVHREDHLVYTEIRIPQILHQEEDLAL